jgi:hypothetical protein
VDGGGAWEDLGVKVGVRCLGYWGLGGFGLECDSDVNKCT